MRHIIKKSNLPTPIKQTSRLKPNSHKMRKSMQGVITLTSLIDAFVIIVIYLVVCSSPSDNQIDIQDNITLPQAQQTHELDGSPVVTYKNNQFFIENTPVVGNTLKERLQLLVSRAQSALKNKESAIIVQADEKVDFTKLQPLLVASAHAGIKHVKFAVLQGE